MTKTIRLSEQQIRKLIKEVRYIDASQRWDKGNGEPYRNNSMDVYNQKPIRYNSVFRVYHGCTLKTALRAATQGLSGKEWTPRTYSYEQGMNPIGLFVTTDFNKAADFSTDHEAQVVLEFSVRGSQLDSPVWNGQGTYFGQGSNPMPFHNAKERTIQKRQYNNDIEFDNTGNYEDYVKKSWNPAMADKIFNNNEHQALFYGDLNPNMIKRFWVRERKSGANYISTEDSFIKYTRKEFLRKFQNSDSAQKAQFDRDGYQYEKLFLPSDDFTSVDDLANRLIQRERKLHPKAFHLELEKVYKGDIQKMQEQYVKVFNEYYIKDHNFNALLIYMWPKQLRQLFGDDTFQKYYDTLDQLKGYK